MFIGANLVSWVAKR
jgi:hypothetical protein